MFLVLTKPSMIIKNPKSTSFLSSHHGIHYWFRAVQLD